MALVIKNLSDYVYVTCDGVGEGETMSIYTIDNKYNKKIWTNFYQTQLGYFILLLLIILVLKLMR